GQSLGTDEALHDSVLSMKKDIMSAKRIIAIAAHPRQQWLSMQVCLHEEVGCLMTALKRSLDFGNDADAQLQGDPYGKCFEAYSRVVSSMQSLIQKLRKLEAGMTACENSSTVEAEEGRGKMVEADAAFLQNSCVNAYEKMLTNQQKLVGAWCQVHSGAISAKVKALQESSKGLCISGGNSWKNGLAADLDLKGVLDAGSPKINSIDGAQVSKDVLDLKQVCDNAKSFLEKNTVALQLMGDEAVKALQSNVKDGTRTVMEGDTLIIEGMMIRAFMQKIPVKKKNDLLVTQMDKKADKEIPDDFIHPVLLSSALDATASLRQSRDNTGMAEPVA
ncbi:unnamed protein product, partial [Symbiodinium pilosum]